MHHRGKKALQDYADGKLDFEPEAQEVFEQFLDLFGHDLDGTENDAGIAARTVYEAEKANRQVEDSVEYEDKEPRRQDPEPVDTIENDEPEFVEETKRQRSANSDDNQYIMDRVAAAVYKDMGLITEEQHNKTSVQETIRVLNSVPKLTEDQQIEFSERFIDCVVKNENLFHLVPPKTLAYAYQGTKQRLTDNNVKNKDVLQARLNTIAQRIDDLSVQFNSNSGLYFADHTNIADIYDGYNYMFDVRRPDLDTEKDAAKIQQIEANKNLLEDFITDYDNRWGLNDLTPTDAEQLSKKWADLTRRVDEIEISDDTMRLASQYNFLDADGNPIPQFIDGKGQPSLKYQEGFVLDKNGRLARVVDLARHDVVMQNVTKHDDIDDATLATDLNDQIPLKLFEIDTADKVVQGAMENPEQFTDPKHLQEFVNNLGQNGGAISEQGYQAAMDQQVNKTAGWAGRVKQKLKDGAKKSWRFLWSCIQTNS